MAGDMQAQDHLIEEVRKRYCREAANTQQLQIQANSQISGPALRSNSYVAPRNHQIPGNIFSQCGTGQPQVPLSLTNDMTMAGSNVRLNSGREDTTGPGIFATNQRGVKRRHDESVVRYDLPAYSTSFASNPGPRNFGQGGSMNAVNHPFGRQTRSTHLPSTGPQNLPLATTKLFPPSNHLASYSSSLTHTKLRVGQLDEESKEYGPDSFIWVNDGSAEYHRYLASIQNQVPPAHRLQTVDPGSISGPESSFPSATDVNGQNLFEIVKDFVVRTRHRQSSNRSIPTTNDRAGDGSGQPPTAKRPKLNPARPAEAVPAVRLPVELMNAMKDSGVLGETEDILSANVDNYAEKVKEAERRRDARELAAAEEAARLAALPTVDQNGNDYEHYASRGWARHEFEEILRIEKDAAERTSFYNNPPFDPERYCLILDDLSDDDSEIINNRIGMTVRVFHEAMQWLDQLIPGEGVLDRNLE